MANSIFSSMMLARPCCQEQQPIELAFRKDADWVTSLIRLKRIRRNCGGLVARWGNQVSAAGCP